MEKFVTWYLLLLKSHGRRRDTWLAVFAMLSLTLLLSSVTLPGQDNTTVLLYCGDKALLSEVMDALSERESVFTFVEAESLAAVKQEVSAGRAECAFVLADDFRERLEGLELKGLVTYYAAVFTTKGEVAKETLYAALLPIESEVFLETAAPELYEAPDDELLALLKERQQEYLSGTQLFTVREIALSGSGADEEETQAAGAQPIRGMLAVFLFLFLFFSVGEIRHGAYGNFFAVLDGRGSLLFSVAYGLSAVTLPGAAAFLILWGTGGFASFFPELFRLLFLIAYSVVWCLAVSFFLRSKERYPACTAALLLLNVLLCPVYLDLSAYFPVIGYLRALLPAGAYLML